MKFNLKLAITATLLIMDAPLIYFLATIIKQPVKLQLSIVVMYVVITALLWAIGIPLIKKLVDKAVRQIASKTNKYGFREIY